MLHYVMETHGALTANDAVHAELGGVLTGSPNIPRPVAVELAFQAPDVLLAGETLNVTVTSAPGLLIEVMLTPALGSRISAPHRQLAAADDTGTLVASFPDLPPGGYALAARIHGAAAGDAVTTPIAVFEPGRP